MEQDPKTADLIARIYGARQKRIDGGLKPRYLIINKDNYNSIQLYHAALGELPNSEVDYISKDRIFDLEICLEGIKDFKIL